MPSFKSSVVSHEALRDCGSPAFPPASYLPPHSPHSDLLSLSFQSLKKKKKKKKNKKKKRYSFPQATHFLAGVFFPTQFRRRLVWVLSSPPSNIVVWHIAGAHCIGWKNAPHGFLSGICLTLVSGLHFWKAARYPLLKRGVISTLETKPSNVSKPVPPPPESNNMIYTVDFSTMSFSFICSTCPKS
jgi:hypothetical protein